jgi:translation initiation factor IF-3
MRRDSLLPPSCKDIVDALRNVRVVDKTGRQLGIMTLNEAWSMAERELAELLLISPSASPPVYRITNRRITQKPSDED